MLLEMTSDDGDHTDDGDDGDDGVPDDFACWIGGCALAATLQLAKQARSAARQGDCDTAHLLTRLIAERDPGYADALAASPARCR